MTEQGSDAARDFAVQDLDQVHRAVHLAIEDAVTVGALGAEDGARLAAEVDDHRDPFELHDWLQPTKPLAVRLCKYPGCFESPRGRSSASGGRPVYCDVVRDAHGRPAHDPLKSMRERRRRKAQQDGTAEPEAVDEAIGDRPVSVARTSVPALVDQVKAMVAEQRTAQERALAALATAIETLGDPEAQDAELQGMRERSDQQIEALTTQNSTLLERLRGALDAETRSAGALEEAVEAAEDAHRRAERIQADCDTRVAEVEERARRQAEADQARVTAAEKVVVDANERIEQADRKRQLAEQGEASATEDQARLAEANQRLGGELDRARVEIEAANERVEAAERRREADLEALRADHRAERERTSKETGEAATRAAQELADLRSRLDQADARHRAELAEVRKETGEAATRAAQELAEVRKESREDADRRVAELREIYEGRVAELREQLERRGEAEAAPARQAKK